MRCNGFSDAPPHLTGRRPQAPPGRTFTDLTRPQGVFRRWDDLINGRFHAIFFATSQVTATKENAPILRSARATGRASSAQDASAASAGRLMSFPASLPSAQVRPAFMSSETYNKLHIQYHKVGVARFPNVAFLQVWVPPPHTSPP